MDDVYNRMIAKLEGLRRDLPYGRDSKVTELVAMVEVIKAEKPAKKSDSYMLAAANSMFDAIDALLNYMPQEDWERLPEHIQKALITSHLRAGGLLK
jgi:hypothetical protein